jgi:hypothetical protein
MKRLLAGLPDMVPGARYAGIGASMANSWARKRKLSMCGVVVLAAAALGGCASAPGTTEAGNTGSTAAAQGEPSRDALNMVARKWSEPTLVGGNRPLGFWFLATHTDKWRITAQSEFPDELQHTRYDQDIFYYSFDTDTIQPAYPQFGVRDTSAYFNCPTNTRPPVTAPCASPIVDSSGTARALGAVFGHQDVVNNKPSYFSATKMAQMIDGIGVAQLRSVANQMHMDRYNREFARAQNNREDAEQFIRNFKRWDPMNRVTVVQADLPALRRKEAAEQSAQARNAAKAESDKREKFFRSARRGSQLFCHTGSMVLGENAGLDSLAYDCSGVGIIALSELESHGYVVTSQDQVAVPTYTGRGYRVSLILTKR